MGLDYLYDYFSDQHYYIYQPGESQQWFEVHDKINNASHNLSLQAKIILKNIGVINLLSGALGIKAHPDIIYYVMEYSHNISREVTKHLIQQLIANGYILYREYSDEYRLWEGSDFDVYGAIHEKKPNSLLVL